MTCSGPLGPKREPPPDTSDGGSCACWCSSALLGWRAERAFSEIQREVIHLLAIPLGVPGLFQGFLTSSSIFSDGSPDSAPNGRSFAADPRTRRKERTLVPFHGRFTEVLLP